MRSDSMRRASTGLLVIGIVALVIGLIALAGSAAPRNQTWSIALPGLAGHYERVVVPVLTGGSLAVTFSTDSPVTIYVFTDAQHTAFLQTGVAQALGQDTGTSGSFTTVLPGGGTYYVEITHASGFESSPANGVLNDAVAGIDPAPFYVGVVGLVVGVLLVVLGIRYRGIAKKRAASELRPMAYPPPYVAPSWPPYPMPPAAGSGMAPSAAYPVSPQGAPPGSQTSPIVGAMLLAVPSGTGAILVTVENRTATDESVQLLVNGVPSVSLTIPAGRTGQAHLRTPAAPSPGSPVRVEIVTASGGRGGQDVVVAAEGTSQVTLRIG